MENNTVVVDEELLEFWGVEHEDNEKLLQYLIQTRQDLAEFMDRFYDGNIIRNMMAYKNHKEGKPEQHYSKTKKSDDFLVVY